MNKIGIYVYESFDYWVIWVTLHKNAIYVTFHVTYTT